jgi:hypothetical protein
MATVERDQGLRPGPSAARIDRRRRRHGTAGEFGHSIALTSGASPPHLRRRPATRSVEVSWPTGEHGEAGRNQTRQTAARLTGFEDSNSSANVGIDGKAAGQRVIFSNISTNTGLLSNGSNGNSVPAAVPAPRAVASPVVQEMTAHHLLLRSSEVWTGQLGPHVLVRRSGSVQQGLVD